jgi:signal transduction histidine kinase
MPATCDDLYVSVQSDLQQPGQRRVYRSADGRLLGGVARGLAEHLRTEVVWIRLAFVLLTLAGGIGIVLYGAFWIVLPQQVAADAPRRSSRRFNEHQITQVVAFAALVLGAVLVLQRLEIARIGYPFAISLALAAAGAAMLWRQLDDAQRARWLLLTGERRAGIILRMVLGAVLVLGGSAFFLASRSNFADAGESILAILVVTAGLAVISSPFWLRLIAELTAERRERIRSQERAEFAAHVHDSVLQTLAMIQRHVDDPREVGRLARAQERALRGWLYRRPATPGASFKTALEELAGEVEDEHIVEIDVVVVGDCPLTEATAAQLRAAREAMVNAAKYGAPAGATISVYAEIDDGAVNLFVRDRGPGFDPDSVPADRLGIRESIIGRMRRNGGNAQVRSAPGEGSEVLLEMPREPVGRGA